MIERSKVMNASMFNLQNGIHVKPGLKQRKHEAKHVKLCRELLSLRQILPSIRQKLSCFTENTSARIEGAPVLDS